MFSRCITFETRDIIQLIGSVVEFPGVLGCLGKTYFQADIPFGFMFSLQCLMYAAEKKQATSLGSLLGPLLWSLVKCSGGGWGVHVYLHVTWYLFRVIDTTLGKHCKPPTS